VVVAAAAVAAVVAAVDESVEVAVYVVAFDVIAAGPAESSQFAMPVPERQQMISGQHFELVQ